MTDFGFENGWKDVPLPVAQCRDKKHATTDIDEGQPMRGWDHVVRCPLCDIKYHYDSSD